MKRSSPHPREVRRRAVRPVIEHRESLWSRHGSARFADKFGMPPRRTAAGRHRPKVDIGWRLAAGGWRLAAGGWRLAAGGWRSVRRTQAAAAGQRRVAARQRHPEVPRPVSSRWSQTAHAQVVEDSGAVGGLHHPECLIGQVKQVRQSQSQSHANRATRQREVGRLRWPG
jgi:hypothetical protein